MQDFNLRLDQVKPETATADMRIRRNGDTILIDDFDLKGGTFRMAGAMTIAGNTLTKANFSSVRLNRGDDASVSVIRNKGGYDVNVDARSLDLRSLLKRVLSNFEGAAAATGGETVRLKASIGSASGFGSQSLQGVQASYVGKGSRILSFKASAKTENGGSIAVENTDRDGRKNVVISTTDGGALLRFLDIYDKMRGGSISIVLAENGDGVLGGEVDAKSFTIVGEPRLKSLVGTPVTRDGQSVAKAGKIDVSAVKFQRGTAQIWKAECAGLNRASEAVFQQAAGAFHASGKGAVQFRAHGRDIAGEPLRVGAHGDDQPFDLLIHREIAP